MNTRHGYEKQRPGDAIGFRPTTDACGQSALTYLSVPERGFEAKVELQGSDQLALLLRVQKSKGPERARSSSQPANLRFRTKRGGKDFVREGTYDCHAREDGKGEPGACHGGDLREPSFQTDDGHLDAVCAAEAESLL